MATRIAAIHGPRSRGKLAVLSDFGRRACLNGEGVDALGQQIGQRGVHHPLSVDAGTPIECGRDDLDREMAFAARIMPGMAAMLVAVVDDGQRHRLKRLCEPGVNFLCDRSHNQSIFLKLSLYRRFGTEQASIVERQ